MKDRFIALMVFLLINQIGQAQYCIDGNYCPITSDPIGNSCNASTSNEWSDAVYVSLPGGSSSCHVNDLWADIDEVEKNVVVAITRGNAGTATFLYFFNTDCNNNTGDTSIGQGGIARNGAEFRIQLEVKNNGSAIVEDVGEWNGSAYGVSASSGVAAAGSANGCSGTDFNFVEFSFPLSEIFDFCNTGGCGAVELTLVETRSGGSLNSSPCDEATVVVQLTANDPPSAEFELPSDTLCRSANTGAWPNIFIDASQTLDVNIGSNNDSLDYAWSSNLEDDATAFSNPSGTKITNMSSINTNYQTTQAGFHFITLTVTDNYGCSSSQSGTSDPLYRILILDSNTEYCSLLPISLSEFTAELMVNNQAVELNWTTESETNSEFFYVMRMEGNNDNFKQIAQLNASGNSTTTTHYNYVDEIKDVDSDIVYYQLNEVDFDGSITYSDVAAVRLSDNSLLEVLIQPNPISDMLNVQVIGSDEPTEMLVQNINGQVMLKKSIHPSQMGTTLSFETSQFTTGTYLISFNNSKQNIQKKILIIK